MQINYHKSYSNYLNREMEFKVFGHAGIVLLAFPSQDGRFYDYENRNLIQSISYQIDQGKVMVLCCDSIDGESWSAEWKNINDRISAHEAYFNYICQELLPLFRDLYPNQRESKVYATGCSLGAYHALNIFFRMPNLFAGCICLSGVYSTYPFFGSYSNEIIYQNSPNDFINGMHYDHPYVEKYRQKQIYICCGQGAWEHPMLEDTRRLEELLKYKNIPAHVEYWGFDVSHDWPWWEKQFPYYVTQLINAQSAN